MLLRIIICLSCISLASCSVSKMLPKQPFYIGTDDDPQVTFQAEHNSVSRANTFRLTQISFYGEIGGHSFLKKNGESLKNIHFYSAEDVERFLERHPEEMGSSDKKTEAMLMWKEYRKKHKERIKWLGIVYPQNHDFDYNKSDRLKMVTVTEDSYNFTIKLPANESVALQGVLLGQTHSCAPSATRFSPKPKTNYIATYTLDSEKFTCVFNVKEISTNGELIPVKTERVIPEDLYELKFNWFL